MIGGVLHVALLAASYVTLVMVILYAADTAQEREGEPWARDWLRVAWHRWRFHTITETANGDVVCWSCTRPLVWRARPFDEFGGAINDPEDAEPVSFDRHAEDAIRVVRDWPKP